LNAILNPITTIHVIIIVGMENVHVSAGFVTSTEAVSTFSVSERKIKGLALAMF